MYRNLDKLVLFWCTGTITVLLLITLETEESTAITCANGEFPCGNISRCLHQVFQCDNKDDCGNNADEENCENDRGVAETMDKHFTNRFLAPTLNASYCNLSYYPTMCTCKRHTNLVCKRQNLTHVPKNIHPNVTTLILMENNMTQVRANDFGALEQLGTLYLSENAITEIADNSFQNLSNLNWLFLGSNRLKSLNNDVFAGLHNLYWLDLNSNELESLNQGRPFHPLKRLVMLELFKNKLKRIDSSTFKPLASLETLDISRNEIAVIEAGAFDGINLTVLNLSSNYLHQLPDGINWSFLVLQDLDLSNNPLSIYEDTFEGLDNLIKLGLQNLDIPNIKREMFQELPNLKIILFKRFRYCKFAINARNCYPKTDGISTYENLLENPILRVSVWTMALLTTFGNISVLICRRFMHSESKVHSIVVSNLCASDYIMGVYLFVIGIQDARFRNEFYRFTMDWSESPLCHIAGFLAVLSTEASVLSLAFISLERVIIIAFPYKPKRFNSKQTIIALLLMWTIALTLAGLPFFMTSFGNYYGRNGVCFPLNIHDPFVLGWQYSAFVFLGVNALCFGVIIASYLGMYLNIRATRKMSASQNGVRGDLGYAKRFFCIVLSDCICWLPLAVFKIVALTDCEIPESLYAWLIIFVVPINSALNPIIYTMSTDFFKQKLSRSIKSKIPGYGERHYTSCVPRPKKKNFELLEKSPQTICISVE